MANHAAKRFSALVRLTNGEGWVRDLAEKHRLDLLRANYQEGILTLEKLIERCQLQLEDLREVVKHQ